MFSYSCVETAKKFSLATIYGLDGFVEKHNQFVLVSEGRYHYFYNQFVSVSEGRYHYFFLKGQTASVIYVNQSVIYFF